MSPSGTQVFGSGMSLSGCVGGGDVGSRFDRGYTISIARSSRIAASLLDLESTLLPPLARIACSRCGRLLMAFSSIGRFSGLLMFSK